MKKAKRTYTNSQIYHLAHKLGLPGNTSHKVIGNLLITMFGYTGGWKKSLSMFFSEPKEIYGIEPYKKAKSSFVFKHPTEDVSSKDFLQSYEWRKLRLVALKLHGRRCLCCGATPETGAVLHVDHIKPRKNYPDLALDINNLQVLCHECNHGKGNWDETDWRIKP